MLGRNGTCILAHSKDIKSYIEILLIKQNFPHSSEAIPFDVCIAKGARWWVKMMVIGDCRESP